MQRVRIAGHHALCHLTRQPFFDGFHKVSWLAPLSIEFNFFQNDGTIIAADDIDFIAANSCDLTRGAEIRPFKKPRLPDLHFFSLEEGESTWVWV